MYATGNFTELLQRVDQLLESQPGQSQMLLYRAAALMNMEQVEAAKETLQLSLGLSGYVTGQQLSGDQLFTAAQLANIFEHLGNTTERDELLMQILKSLDRIRKDEPANSDAMMASAFIASIQNDLPGALRALTSAVEYGFRSHWELVRNPIFQRWQDNPQFMGFYQGMLKAAANMQREYRVNNPSENSGPATESLSHTPPTGETNEAF